ncbi:DUF3515 domain-containing protein [Corynebacterium sp.]|uniref:DUF3515 domain-containing protein n=1 Tax=Corynebacterium sp. TaxID=1720 RepID=UPI0026DB704A|nr:DUF3515 domain-containing protein [Corynebacterium sp.]MDO5077972.1 DUF3515 domain-containing protein [Corynebacterium sp.]
MSAEQPYHRRPLIFALVLAVLLVVGVLTGAKIVYDRAAHQPVGMSIVDAPDAAACGPLLDALPDTLARHPRAELADPAPEGAAAWASNSTDRITLRCGITLPLQYTKLSETTQAAGAAWLRVKDATPGANLETWYTVDRFPIVAVTAAADATDPVAGLDEALSKLDAKKFEPHPVPLTDLKRGNADACPQLMNALPETLGEYQRSDIKLEQTMAAWTATGLEPIVLRCGVADAPGYAAGAQLQQVDNVPWFLDTTLASGTTAGTWYALGRSANVAVSMPQSAGNTALVEFTTAIDRNLSEQAPAQ